MKNKSTAFSAKGFALALLVVPATIVLWVVIWRMGFMASIVSLATAFGTVWLYQLGAGGTITKPAAFALFGVIIVSVVLAFLAGMASDMHSAYVEVYGSTSLMSADFWSFYFSMLGNGEVWSDYSQDIMWALGFAVLGAGWTVKDLFMPPRAAKK